MKRPYRKPDIILRETLEVIAADCGVPGGKDNAVCSIGFS